MKANHKSRQRPTVRHLLCRKTLPGVIALIFTIMPLLTSGLCADDEDGLIAAAVFEAENSGTADPTPGAGPEDSAAAMDSIVSMDSIGSMDSLAVMDSLAAMGEIQDMVFSVTNTTYNSYAPSSPAVQITINISIDESYTGGGVIELPLSCPDAAAYPDFSYGTNGTDGAGSGGAMPAFFVEGSHSAGDMVKSIDSSTTPGCLTIFLKDDTDAGFHRGLSTIILRFDFNPVWRSKVPPGTLLWSIEPAAYLRGEEVLRPAPVQVVRNSDYGDAVVSVSGAPSAVYYGGAITGSFLIDSASSAAGSMYLILDPMYVFTAWLEIPEGSLLSPEAGAVWGAPVSASGGYDRYEASLTHAQGSVTRTFTPPASIAVGEVFEARGGISGFRYVNCDPVAAEVTAAPAVFTKADPGAIPQWTLKIPDFDSPAAICFLSDGAATGGFQQTSNTDANCKMENTGAYPVTGASLDLRQISSGPPKVNFGEIALSLTRNQALSPWSYYSVSYDIVDALSGLVDYTLPDALGVLKPSGTSTSVVITLLPPSPGANRYIGKVTVTPMGEDGVSPGVLPAGNGFGLKWKAAAWNGRVWPDGSNVAQYSAAMLGWIFNYDDNPGAPDDYPASGGIPASSPELRAAVYYSEAPVASVTITSSPSMSAVVAGDVLDVTIHGRNYFDASSVPGYWIDPRIMIKVPGFMKLLPGEGSGGLGRGAADGAFNVSFSVDAALTYSDENYNYYSFQAINYSAPPVTDSSSYSFSIPARFEITGAAYAGSYQIYTLVSSLDAENFIMNSGRYDAMNSLPSGLEGDEPLFGLGGKDSYFFSGYNALTVPSLPSVAVSSAVKNEWTDNVYISSSVVPAKLGSDAYVRLSLTNTGNTPLNNIRLYNIIPKDGDKLGSSGAMTLESVSASRGAPSIYYASEASLLPSYGSHGPDNPNLQGAAFWGGGDWSETGRTADATAVFIDFGLSYVLGVGEEVDIELLFRAPADAMLTVYNQFRYSARQQDDPGTFFNLNSQIAGFSTSAIAIEYRENLPAPLSALIAAENMPAGVTSFFGAPPASDHYHSGIMDSLQVSASGPTLEGYSFSGWNTAQDGNGESYPRGSWKQFSGGGLLLLYAQWKPDGVPPSEPPPADPSPGYNDNGGDSGGGSNENESGDGGAILVEAPDENIDDDVYVDDDSTITEIEVDDDVGTGDDSDDQTDGRAGVEVISTPDIVETNPRPDSQTEALNSQNRIQAPPAVRVAGQNAPESANAPPEPTPPTPDVFTIRFVDWNGTVLSEQIIERGGVAAAPPDPARDGYTFGGWDMDFTNVQSDLTVVALYTANAVVAAPQQAPPMAPDVPESLRFLEKVAGDDEFLLIFDDDIPRISFGNYTIPLYGGNLSEYVWALVNLILGAVGAALALLTAIRVILRKRRENKQKKSTYIPETERGRKQTRLLWVVVTILLGAAGAALFMLTEDTSKIAVFVDYWTIAHAVMIVLEITSLILSFKREK